MDLATKSPGHPSRYRDLRVFRLRGVPDEDAWYGYPIFSGELHRIVAKIAECHEPIVASTAASVSQAKS